MYVLAYFILITIRITYKHGSLPQGVTDWSTVTWFKETNARRRLYCKAAICIAQHIYCRARSARAVGRYMSMTQTDGHNA